MMTIDEKCELYDKADELRKQGKIEDADILESQIPIAAHIAMAMKEVFGADKVSKLTVNLSEAEEVYGKDWLTK